MDNINICFVDGLDISLAWVHTDGCGPVDTCHSHPGYNNQEIYSSLRAWLCSPFFTIKFQYFEIHFILLQIDLSIEDLSKVKLEVNYT